MEKANARFGSEFQQRLQRNYADVRTISNKAEYIVEKIISEYAKPLDMFVDAVERMLERIEKGESFSDYELTRMVVRLPTIMYRLGDLMDRAAIMSDIAKAVTRNMRAVRYLQSTAKTIPAKTAEAELFTAENDDVVELTKHIYQRLKHKFETADRLFDAIRKVITSRDTDKTVFGRESRGPGAKRI